MAAGVTLPAAELSPPPAPPRPVMREHLPTDEALISEVMRHESTSPHARLHLPRGGGAHQSCAGAPPTFKPLNTQSILIPLWTLVRFDSSRVNEHYHMQLRQQLAIQSLTMHRAVPSSGHRSSEGRSVLRLHTLAHVPEPHRYPLPLQIMAFPKLAWQRQSNRNWHDTLY